MPLSAGAERLPESLGRALPESDQYASSSGCPAKSATTAPSARNGPNGIPIFRAAPPWRAKQHDRRHERRDHPEHQRHRHRPPERRARAAGRASRRPSPCRAGYASAAASRKPEAPSGAIAHSGLGWSAVCAASTIAAAGQDDPVRDDPVLEVGRRDRDEREAEEGGDGRLGVEPELPDAGGDEQRRRRARPPGSARRSRPAGRGSGRAGGATRRAARCRTTRSPRRSSCTPSPG